jgi:hypothetical protein
VVSLRAYAYMDSAEFCGLLCHTVMRPEYVTYQHSPHARVECTACHIGPGADWFVRSKISGLRQVWNVATNAYPRPIPVPIKDLRPARETCEKCHWPEKFFGDQVRTWTTFASDETNTPSLRQMTIKTGGGGGEFGEPAGIHWHVSAHNTITYVATDGERQKIAWVRQERPGEPAIEYNSKDIPITPDALAKAEKRTMDCMDCHNRPTHHIQSPDKYLDQAISAGYIDAKLPFIKKQGLALLSRTYPNEQTALQTIKTELTAFYQTSYPQQIAGKSDSLERAIYEMQRAYWGNAFPEMKVNFQSYPENIGHQTSPGCFRCHDGKHTRKDGQAIRQECTLCHTPPAAAK